MVLYRAAALIAALAITVPASAQFGHPLKGTWSGDWGTSEENQTHVVLELSGDGKAITGRPAFLLAGEPEVRPIFMGSVVTPTRPARYQKGYPSRSQRTADQNGSDTSSAFRSFAVAKGNATVPHP